MLNRVRLLTLALPAAAALAVPQAAGAVCAQQSLAELARSVPVVVTATAQPGPLTSNNVGLLSPATFTVFAYDRGSGPGTLRVQTAITQGGPGGFTVTEDAVNPMPGQTWRLWGTIGDDGVLRTSTCLGSRLRGAESPPKLTAGKGRATLRAANFAGRPKRGSLPTLRVRKKTRVVLKLAAREANYPVSRAAARALVAVRLQVGKRTTTVPATWSASDGILTTRLARPRSKATLIVITRAGSYAARLRAG